MVLNFFLIDYSISCLICDVQYSIHSIDPQQGERILDMCAAPGGKTTAIAILMRDKGEIVALDRSHNKVISLCQIQHMISHRVNSSI
jgi:16S rRNA C967 or C1407 C5-methylase (RsmB/RsmF family)